jgi:hypothetical protein
VITVAGPANAEGPTDRIGRALGRSAKRGTPAQAADVPLDADAEDDDEEEEEAAGAGVDDFESDPVDEDEAEPDAFADDDADELLDEEPRLSFR